MSDDAGACGDARPSTAAPRVERQRSGGAACGVHFVSSEAVAAVLSWPEAIEAVRAVYAQPVAAGAVPRRTVARDREAWLRTLPAIPPGGAYFGAKLMGTSTVAADPAVNYLIVLYERATSRIASLMDGHLVTAYRTAATSAVALDRLAPRRPLTLGVIGSGLEASMHIRAFAAVRPLREVAIHSPTAAHREGLAAAIAEELAVPARAARSATEALEGADVTLAAARSHDERPLLFGRDLRDGMTVVSIGSTVPEQREIDASVVERCDLIVCDDVEEVSGETGDMLAAAAARIPFREKTFSLRELLLGALDERCAAAALPMFKSVGGGLQDLAVAELVLRRALEEGLTIRLPVSFTNKR